MDLLEGVNLLQKHNARRLLTKQFEGNFLQLSDSVELLLINDSPSDEETHSIEVKWEEFHEEGCH